VSHDEIGTIAPADEVKRELARQNMLELADGVADMDLPEDAAQMQFEQHDSAANAAAAQVQCAGFRVYGLRYAAAAQPAAPAA